MLHYKSQKWFIGDCHPFYENGYLYLFYLKPRGIIKCTASFKNPEEVVCSTSVLAISDDYLNFAEHDLGEIVISVVKHDDKYYSYSADENGNSRCIVSDDLINWQRADKTFDVPRNTVTFPAGARDSYIFYDEDIKKYRCTIMTYRTNKHWAQGEGLDCSISISTSFEESLKGFCGQSELIRFENKDVDIMKAEEPECSQMVKIGTRWYIITSLARQSVHWVGAPSYLIGAENTIIDHDDWSEKQVNKLDGEDLAAAQIAKNGDKFYIFGWIPMNCLGEEWGGHLNLPREVYSLNDGRLASRLDKDFFKKIKGEIITQVIIDSFLKVDNDYASESFMDLTDFGIIIDFEFAENQNYLAVDVDTENGVRVTVTKEKIIISRFLSGYTWNIFSEIDILKEELYSKCNLNIISEEDILEVFFNDKYSLAARIHNKIKHSRLKIFSDKELLNTNVEIYNLKKN